MAIKYLVDDLHKSISSKITGVIARSDVHWVLTVPAIWTDQAKQFMREAAERAGIASDKLSIALEPEAASVYCRHLPIDKSEGNLSISALSVGTKYMILDAGGGTIDITVHEVVDDVSMKEVTAACGGGWGGTLVDQAFETLVVDLVGLDVFSKFKTEETEDYLELMRDFEVKKRNIRPEKEGRVMMRFPASLVRMSENNGRNIALYVRTSSKYTGKIDFVSDKIKFHADIFKQLFEYSYSKTLEHVGDVFKQNNLQDLNLILMVGGYSESAMLQQAVKNAYPTKRVVIPNEASSAIMKGALIFGHRPEFISQRVLKYTYGIRTACPFIEGFHPWHRRYKTDKGDHCSDIFHKHVEKGQNVRIGDVQMKQTYVSLSQDQKSTEFRIFSSLMQNPEYTTDVGCTELGHFDIDIAKGEQVEVSFTFGGTEIKVEALNQITGEKRKLAIDLLS